MLLAHTSGMNSGADYREILGENVEEFALRSELVAKPGERVIYSDLGFIALGVALRRISGLSLGTLVAREFPGPLHFRPRLQERRAIPATEEDGWRGRVQGYRARRKGVSHGRNGRPCGPLWDGGGRCRSHRIFI